MIDNSNQIRYPNSAFIGRCAEILSITLAEIPKYSLNSQVSAYTIDIG
jgi:hypothetical protein